MRQALDEGKIVIVAGFQGVDEKANITTLGRGGSDTTAVALAAALKLAAIADLPPSPLRGGGAGGEVFGGPARNLSPLPPSPKRGGGQEGQRRRSTVPIHVADDRRPRPRS